MNLSEWRSLHEHHIKVLFMEHIAIFRQEHFQRINYAIILLLVINWLIKLNYHKYFDLRTRELAVERWYGWYSIFRSDHIMRGSFCDESCILTKNSVIYIASTVGLLGMVIFNHLFFLCGEWNYQISFVSYLHTCEQFSYVVKVWWLLIPFLNKILIHGNNSI